MGISPYATDKQIHHSYRIQMRRLSARARIGEDVGAMATELDEAYSILSDPYSRAIYDVRMQLLDADIDPNDLQDVYVERTRRRDLIKHREQAVAEQQWRVRFYSKIRRGVLIMGILPLFLFLDYNLPRQELVEHASKGWQVTYRSSRTSRIVSFMLTESGVIHVPHDLHIDYDYTSRPPVVFALTPLTRTRVAATTITRGQPVTYDIFQGIYAAGQIFTALMFVVWLFYLLNKRYAYWKLTIMFVPVMLVLFFIYFSLRY